MDEPKIIQYVCTPEEWHHVTKPLEEYLVSLGCRVRQMKEKFCELRVYYEWPDPDTDLEKMDKAEGAVTLAKMIIEGMYSD